MSQAQHMTPEQVDQMIAGLVERKVGGFKFSHCLRLNDGRIWCLDIDQVFDNLDMLAPAMQEYCRHQGKAGAMADAAPADGWKRFVAAPKDMTYQRHVFVRESLTGWVFIMLRTEAPA